MDGCEQINNHHTPLDAGDHFSPFERKAQENFCQDKLEIKKKKFSFEVQTLNMADLWGIFFRL